MSEKYMLVDFAILTTIARYGVYGSDIDTQIGFAMQTILEHINVATTKLSCSHIVVCLEGKSWRKDIYPAYKLNRKLKKLTRTQKEIENDQLFFESMDEFSDFLRDNTNVTVLQEANSEADDLIARWIDLHPNDEHVIFSTDSDFQQLLYDNVSIYKKLNNVEELITIDGIFDMDGSRSVDKKTGEPKSIPEPSYILFEKCIRGDPSDNIFSAYPGVRKKGTKNKTGLLDAYADMDNKGYDWNNFILQKWVDKEGKEQLVRDHYEMNRTLIDLSMQPDRIKEACKEVVIFETNKPVVKSVGMKFLRFCNQWDLKRVVSQSEKYANALTKSYKGEFRNADS